MKKILIALVLVCFCVTTFAGCGDEETYNYSPNDSASVQENVGKDNEVEFENSDGSDSSDTENGETSSEQTGNSNKDKWTNLY